MSEEFKARLSRWAWYAKQYWKLQQQAMLMQSTIDYESDHDPDGWDEHPLAAEYEKACRLIQWIYHEGKSTPEMIELTRPLNYGGVLDISQLKFPPELQDFVCKH